MPKHTQHTLRGSVVNALKYGADLLFKKFSPQLGNFFYNASNVAHKFGVPEKITEKGLHHVLTALQRKNERFETSQMGKATIPVTPFDYPSKASNTYSHHHISPNQAFGLGTLGSTPSFGMNSRDLAPAYIGDPQELEEQRNPRADIFFNKKTGTIQKRALHTESVKRKRARGKHVPLVTSTKVHEPKKHKKGIYSLVI